MQTNNQNTANRVKTTQYSGYEIETHFEHFGFGGSVEVFNITQNGTTIKTFNRWMDESSIERLAKVKSWIDTKDYIDQLTRGV